ncbi:LysR family transcriptional regulator [Saxibacter everestensis]|uniref:LysR family transcriptional regulator n=1 Tax=Saxibacter everestensis TaxID=2909229 RepID=A0ABY8QTI6_9MICO|nr:LysR family transcriptional regulator [Brevibacteriaceae bacterium ZFBP1038]
MDLRRVDLNLLVSLDALLRERHVTLAAKRMSVSQPAMSSSLARLRKLLDDPLLVRAGRQLVLTSFAEGLREPLRNILENIDLTLTARPHFDPLVDERTFTIAASDYITLVLLRQVVSRLSAVASGVRLHVQPVLIDYVEHLRQDTIDLIVLPLEVAEDVDDMSRSTLFIDRFVCAADANHPKDLNGITTELFSQLPYIAYRVNGGPSNIDKQLDDLGVARSIEMTTESFLIAPFMLNGTSFIAMLHERLAKEVQDVAGIRLYEPPVPVQPITQTLFWHPRRTEDPAHRWLRELIVDVAQSLETEPPATEDAAGGAGF